MLPHGPRGMCQDGAVYGLQTGSLHKMCKMHEACLRKSSLYGHPLCPQSRLQTGAGTSLLPGSLPA